MVDVIELERQMKMKDEERVDLKEGENNSNEKNHPLSRESWIMLLSGEINKEEMKMTTYEYMGLAIRIAFFGAAVAVLVAAILSDEILLYILCLVMIFFMALPQLIYKMRYLNLHQKRLRPLINLREDIISGKLIDLSKINRIWKYYIKKYYGKLLAKSEMDEEKKELNEGEEKSEEKGSGKSINEQKEVLQAMQRDISNSSQKITRIELGIERTKFVNYLSVVGGFTAAAGLALIVTLIGIYFSLTLGSSAIEYILVFSGVFLLGFGALMIRGTYQELPQKERFLIKKKLSHYAIKASCYSVLIVVLFFILKLVMQS